MVGADATILPFLLGHPAKPSIDPNTKQPVDNLDARIELLIATLDSEQETILIPQPAFSEFLVLADKDGQKYISKIQKNPLYELGDFDLRASVELAALRRHALNQLGKRALKRQTDAETKAKVSFDRQIVAIAKSRGAHTLYSDDNGVRRFAEKHGLRVVSTWQLPRPQVEAQMELEELFDKAEKAKAADESGLSENGS
jgi:predicted nucleic acid-binding protein